MSDLDKFNYECEGQLSLFEKKMDVLTTKMAEYICDNLCQHPCNKKLSEEELNAICCECRMGQFVCDILNEYNRIAEVLP